MIAIKTMDITQDFKKFADFVTQGETVLISRPKNENIVMITETEYNQLNNFKKTNAFIEFKKNLKAMQEQSVKNGTDKMTMDEIDDIIAEVRKEKGK